MGILMSALTSTLGAFKYPNLANNLAKQNYFKQLLVAVN
jgi:hypothetical protein